MRKGNSTVEGSRTDTIHRALRRAIIEQALTPGLKLPEDVIGERYGVSRTIVRTVLERLAAEGLVELRQNRGASVARPTLEEARDVFSVRTSMERLVVETLCGRLDADGEARLRAHVAEEESAHSRDGPESIRLAGEFHTLLATLSGNQLLARYVGELVSRCSLILALYGRPHSSDCAVVEHLALIDALRRGDRETAARLMDEHLEAVMGRALLPRRSDPDIREILAAYAAE